MLKRLGLILLALSPQGVEFFDEKLNTLCMAWLIDHGKVLQQLLRHFLRSRIQRGRHNAAFDVLEFLLRRCSSYLLGYMTGLLFPYRQYMISTTVNFGAQE